MRHSIVLLTVVLATQLAACGEASSSSGALEEGAVVAVSFRVEGFVKAMGIT